MATNLFWFATLEATLEQRLKPILENRNFVIILYSYFQVLSFDKIKICPEIWPWYADIPNVITIDPCVWAAQTTGARDGFKKMTQGTSKHISSINSTSIFDYYMTFSILRACKRIKL